MGILGIQGTRQFLSCETNEAGPCHITVSHISFSKVPDVGIQNNCIRTSNGFYIQFRQSFAKETFSYDEYLKS